MSGATTPDSAIFFGSAPWRSLVRTLVSVGTSATPLPATVLANRKGMYLFNFGTATVFIGVAAVGTTAEVQLFSKQGLFLPISDEVSLFGIVASSSNNIVIWEYTS